MPRIHVGIALSALLALSSALQAPHTVPGYSGLSLLRGNRRLQDSTCSNGLPGYGGINDNGEACCPLDCGFCGGESCGAGGRSQECCINGVLNNQDDCSVTNAAPCVVTEDVVVGGYLGCFQDGRSSYPFPPDDPERIFSERKEDSDEMDAELCMTLCDGEGFDYYGTQFGNECWCGAGTPEDTYLRYGELDESACDVPCAGDPTESCGGNTIMSVYAFGDDVANPTPAPVTEEADACNPNPCNTGTCALDPGGGHICTCPSGWGGMSCQTDTTGLNEFSIELTFTINESVVDNGVVWTDTEMADFRAWADKWENVITHVPCGDGILPIEAEWTSNFVLNPPSPRDDCPQISSGGKLSNSKGLKAWKESDDVWESFVTHEMGHGVGFGYLWGKCTNCVIGDPEPLDGSWIPEVCPATYSAWLDLSGEPDGTVANIVETDSAGLTGECVHFDYDTIPGELNNKGTTHILNENGETAMSKLTLAALEDIGYIVDPSQADPFSIP